MVKKLFKHEILAWCRILPIVYIIFLCIAVMGRIVQFFEADSFAYNMIFFSAIAVYIIGIIACFAFPTVFGIVRFYKNLFSGEGYLSFTLPVTPANHILVKLFVAFMFDVISLLVVVLSALIMTFGEVLSEICNAISYVIAQIPFDDGIHIALYIVEYILMFFILFITKYLLFYLCITVGQLFNKNRILASVGVYFAYYFVCQILGTILGVVFIILGEAGVFDNITFPDLHPYAFVHIMLCSMIVIYGLIAWLYYFITHRIICRRLNLE